MGVGGLRIFWNSEGRELGIILSLFVLKTAEQVKWAYNFR